MSIQQYISENNLEWMVVFNGKTEAYTYAYRGCLVITPGKVISADKSLPPKEIAKQVLLATNGEKVEFLACELETLNLFEGFYKKYEAYFAPEGKYLLFIPDILDKGKFVYNGITFNAYPLVVSSVWNEILDFADLSKGDLKKMSDKEKIDTVCNEMKRTTLKIPEKTYADIKASQTAEGKITFGAV